MNLSTNELFNTDKAYLSKVEMKRAYNAGYLELVYKQLSRYGDITYDYSHNNDEGYYKGSNRHLKFNHHNIEWNVELLNGDVRVLGMKL